jgi:hypothetical protein
MAKLLIKRPDKTADRQLKALIQGKPSTNGTGLVEGTGSSTFRNLRKYGLGHPLPAAVSQRDRARGSARG